MFEGIDIGELNPKRMTSIAIRNGSKIKVVKEAKGVDGTDLTGKVGEVYYILKDVKNEDGTVDDSVEVEESDTLDDIGIDAEFEEGCFLVPPGTYEVVEI